jgi:hypothetical protein
LFWNATWREFGISGYSKQIEVEKYICEDWIYNGLVDTQRQNIGETYRYIYNYTYNIIMATATLSIAIRVVDGGDWLPKSWPGRRHPQAGDAQPPSPVSSSLSKNPTWKHVIHPKTVAGHQLTCCWQCLTVCLTSVCHVHKTVGLKVVPRLTDRCRKAPWLSKMMRICLYISSFTLGKV